MVDSLHGWDNAPSWWVEDMVKIFVWGSHKKHLQVKIIILYSQSLQIQLLYHCCLAAIFDKELPLLPLTGWLEVYLVGVNINFLKVFLSNPVKEISLNPVYVLISLI